MKQTYKIVVNTRRNWVTLKKTNKQMVSQSVSSSVRMRVLFIYEYFIYLIYYASNYANAAKRLSSLRAYSADIESKYMKENLLPYSKQNVYSSYFGWLGGGGEGSWWIRFVGKSPLRILRIICWVFRITQISIHLIQQTIVMF